MFYLYYSNGLGDYNLNSVLNSLNEAINKASLDNQDIYTIEQQINSEIIMVLTH